MVHSKGLTGPTAKLFPAHPAISQTAELDHRANAYNIILNIIYIYADTRIPEAQKFTFIYRWVHKRATTRCSRRTRLSPSDTYPYQIVDIN